MPQTVRVTTDFPGGNARVVETREHGGVPEIVFMPSPAGGPEAMWFCFRVEPSATAPKEVRCVLSLPENLLGGRRCASGFHPVFKTEARDWTRVERTEPSEHPDGRREVSWLVPGDEGAAEVALCYPYGQAELNALCQDLAPQFRSDAIGVTQEGRLLTRLSNGAGGEPQRPGVYCLARQHAGETPGSWVLEGFLRGMAEAGEAAPLVWAVPLADADGVARGLYGKDRFPRDFNRSWGSAKYPEALQAEAGTHPMRHEVMCLQKDMARWAGRCRPACVLDFHAPAMCESAGIYCFLINEDGRREPSEACRPWAEAFEASLGAGLASPEFARFPRYPSRWETARVGTFALMALGVPRFFTFETPYGCTDSQMLTRETYRAAGRRIAEAVLSQSAG